MAGWGWWFIAGSLILVAGCEKSAPDEAAAVDVPEAPVEVPEGTVVFVEPTGSRLDDIVRSIEAGNLAPEDRFGCDLPDEIERGIRELNDGIEEALRQYNERHPVIVRQRELLRELEQDALERCVEAAQNDLFQ